VSFSIDFVNISAGLAIRKPCMSLFLEKITNTADQLKFLQDERANQGCGYGFCRMTGPANG
jgi:hypothetical protein